VLECLAVVLHLVCERNREPMLHRIVVNREANRRHCDVVLIELAVSDGSGCGWKDARVARSLGQIVCGVLWYYFT